MIKFEVHVHQWFLRLYFTVQVSTCKFPNLKYKPMTHFLILEETALSIHAYDLHKQDMI